ncbi:hypothetical protein [Streptomyces sp. LUP47B]|nr:hypothetical protein [Streptomyces sp. LUP47B]
MAEAIQAAPERPHTLPELADLSDLSDLTGQVGLGARGLQYEFLAAGAA